MLRTLIKEAQRAHATACMLHHGPMPRHAFMEVGCTDFYRVPVSWICKRDPAELWFAAQCLRWVSVTQAHEERGFRRACMHMWLKKIVAVRRRRKGHL
jgi:hypothetical protein